MKPKLSRKDACVSKLLSSESGFLPEQDISDLGFLFDNPLKLKPSQVKRHMKSRVNRKLFSRSSLYTKHG